MTSYQQKNLTQYKIFFPSQSCHRCHSSDPFRVRLNIGKSVSAIIERASGCRKLYCGGVHGLIVENHGDIPCQTRGYWP